MIKIKHKDTPRPWYYSTVADLYGDEVVWCITPLAPLVFVVLLAALLLSGRRVEQVRWKSSWK